MGESNEHNQEQNDSTFHFGQQSTGVNKGINLNQTTGVELGGTTSLSYPIGDSRSKGMGAGAGLKPTKPMQKSTGSKSGNLGLRKDVLGSGSRPGVVGFKVGAGKKSRERPAGIKELDSKSHSMVVLDENSNPNFQTVLNDNQDFNLGFMNLIDPNTLPPALKNKMANVKTSMTDHLGSELQVTMAQSVPVDSAIAGIL